MADVNNDGKDDGPQMPRAATAALVVIVLSGALFYTWVAFFRSDSAAMWSNVGQAVGPFVALLNAGALFAALYSVRLQRYELELQRIELRGHREVMEEQRKQFERTARAQERLAEAEEHAAAAQRDAAMAQASLAKAQRDAVSEAARMRLATGTATIAALLGTQTTIQIERARTQRTPFEVEFETRIKDAEINVKAQLMGVVATDAKLRAAIAKEDQA